MSTGEILFYSGIGCMVFGICILIIGIGVFRYTGKKINRKLDETYGEI